ncbi:hypothetical protein AMK68_04050 [candidate division KD3-62 bacterium DG_56]|uniref:Probable DNA ligase n=1 Tax=candidate division KD3-62 bacterium DG_56 TaxID=1704032 RepID=A0A0S7XLG9_9BACT|nr:MAG: hypothetical protein AMK68_04050 [candidate division KD3-62 bacterium DG_56]
MCAELTATRSRRLLADLIAGLLRRLQPAEVAPAVRMLIGRVFPESDPRSLNVSGAALWAALENSFPASRDSYQSAWQGTADFAEGVGRLLNALGHTGAANGAGSIVEVFQRFADIAEASGPGSQARRRELLSSLLSDASPLEAEWIIRIIVGEMRHGVNEGVLLAAVASAAGVEESLVRRGNMLAGDVGVVAEAALRDGERGLRALSVTPFGPLKPMLAQVASDIPDAFETLGPGLSLEYKLDGARVQIHRVGERVAIYSRQLSDVSASLPDIAALVREQMSADAIIEGEVIAISRDGRPLPFQEVMRRFGRVRDLERTERQVPLALRVFDLLWRDGEALIDLEYARRWHELESAAGDLERVARVLPKSVEEGEAFLQRALAEGHEGVMAKRLDAPYTPGVRGKAWLKIKSALSVDLVIIAAEWGYGRRKGWLSNYHLAARDEGTGELAMVGKTFKGLTDAEFQAMTKRLLAIKTSEHGGVVHVEPRVVVEVLFNQIQRSPQYESGIALRFARLARLREDKTPAEADTLSTLRKIASGTAIP